MRNVWIRLLAVVMMVGLLVGCQPTPDKPVVVNQNKDIVEEVKNAAEAKAGESVTPRPDYLAQLELPGHYTYDSKNETASLTIHVDADVSKPAENGMPLARVKPMNFTQDMVTGIFSYLFPDEKPHLPRTQLTKSEIEDMIVHLERAIAKGYDGQPVSDEEKEMLEQQISELEKQYETAPEKAPDPVVSDGTMQYVEQTSENRAYDENGDFEVSEVTSRYYELSVSLGETFMDVRSSADDANPGSSLWYCNTPSNYTTDGMVRIVVGDELPEAARDKLTMPLADAIAKTDGFFKAAGIDDVALFASYLADNHGTGHVDDNYDPASDYAYRLYYTHTVGGVPVSCHESDSASSNGYSEPWFYESIEFLVSEDGILEIQWNEPCAMAEIIEDNVELVDFDAAMTAFENGVGYTYGQYLNWGEGVEVSVDVEIDDIRLSLVRLREKDKPEVKSGLYVPAYVFYGYVKETNVYKNEDYTYEGYKTSSGGGNDYYPGPMMVMAINAIDGSIINTMADVN